MRGFDVVIAGGGVIGCATARAISQSHPSLSVCLLEKETDLALHQSGRNSGVIHAGYNQTPGTLKARFVVDGSKRLRAFCRAKGVRVVQDGILIVARTPGEAETLRELMHRGQTNGAMVKWVDHKELKTREPHAEGLCALLAPEGASLDSRAYVLALAAEARAEFGMAEPVTRLAETSSHVEIVTPKRTLHAGVVVNAAGLYADRLAQMVGAGQGYQILPFRGDYCELVPGRRHLIRSHLYACPDLAFPFLGVHLSRTVEGRVLVGPGALLVPGREAYSRFGFNVGDLAGMLTYQGFWRLVASKTFLELFTREWKKSLFRSQVLKEAQRLIPALKDGDLVPSRAGIRAQLVSRDGRLVDDLTIEQTSRTIHVLNAVSPALTCSLPFADYLLGLIEKKLGL